MKIAHLIPYLFQSIGGLQVCVHNISERHARQGIEVQVFCYDARLKSFATAYSVSRMFNFKGVTRLYPLSRYVIAAYVHRLQQKHHFDIWQINGGYPFGALLIDYFNREKIPCVLRCSGDDIQVNAELDYGVRRNSKINRIIESSYRKFPAVVAITTTVEKEYRSLGVPPENIFLIPNGVDVERIAETTDHGVRCRHHIPDSAAVLLSVGRNHPKKGYDLIPAIMDRLVRQNLDVFWIVIGHGCSRLRREPGFAAWRERLVLIDEIGPTRGRRFVIPSGELLAYYQSADLFAMTSLLETFGIVVVEAMAAGLPVVCFDAPGVRDILTAELGVVCPMKDTAAFADAVAGFIRGDAKALLGGACRRYAARFSWDSIAAAYLSLYHAVAGRGS